MKNQTLQVLKFGHNNEGKENQHDCTDVNGLGGPLEGWIARCVEYLREKLAQHGALFSFTQKRMELRQRCSSAAGEYDSRATLHPTDNYSTTMRFSRFRKRDPFAYRMTAASSPQSSTRTESARVP